MSNITDFGIIYDLSDTTALDDSTPSSKFNSNFADISKIKKKNIVEKLMTLEHNFTTLDGSCKEFTKNVENLSFYSNEMSDENGEFVENPTIDIKFSTVHSTFALTFDFLDNHPLEMKLKWLQAGSVLKKSNVKITQNLQIVPSDVQLFDRLIIEFTKTLPNQYIKLNYLKYGVELNWNETTIKQGKLVQSVSRPSDKLAVNTLNFDLVDTADSMNFGNVQGMHNYFQKNQPMYPYEIVNGNRIELGTFYLDKFTNTNHIGKVKAVSCLGLMNDIQFIKGTIYNGTKAGVILDSIFRASNITNYSIDGETYNQPMFGTIKPMSCRNALKEVLFACNSLIDTTKGDNFKICKPSLKIKSTITRGTKFSTSVSENKYISGVELKYDTFFKSKDEPTEIVKGTYRAGKHKVIFNEPYYNVKLSKGSILDVATYYIEFELESDSEIVITGNQYTTLTSSVTKEKAYIEPGKLKNVKSFKTSLCNAYTASDLAEELLTFHSSDKLTLKIKHLATDVDMNDMRIVENSSRGMGNYVAWFTKRTLDLTGGFIDTAEMVGYFDMQDSLYFSGKELYTNDDTII